MNGPKQGDGAGQQPSDQTFIQVTCAGVILFIGSKVHGSHFWETYRGRILILGTVMGLSALVYLLALAWNRYVERRNEDSVTEKDETAVPLGIDDAGRVVYLKEAFRPGHTHLLGTTTVGKTTSHVFPCIVQDIKNRSGLLLVDGKGDRRLLDQIYAQVEAHGRSEDFRLFTIAYPEHSWAFNPFIAESADLATERVFSSFSITHEYYREIQKALLHAIVTLLYEKGRVPTFALVHRLITDTELLKKWLVDYPPGTAQRYLKEFVELDRMQQKKDSSGLASCLANFALAGSGPLFNQTKGTIDLEEALEKNLIIYFQLPTMLSPFLAAATGKLVLQCLQAAISARHVQRIKSRRFFGCYLDDFQDYIFPEFIGILNKAASVNVGVLFSHQSLGDLDKLGEAFRTGVVTNTNVKVIMRTADPDTRDFYARSFGTVDTEKVTERQQKSLLGTAKTGEGSAREVKEYIHHPDEIRILKRGQAIVGINHEGGVKSFRVTMPKLPDLPLVPLPFPERGIYDAEKEAVAPTNSVLQEKAVEHVRG